MFSALLFIFFNDREGLGCWPLLKAALSGDVSFLPTADASLRCESTDYVEEMYKIKVEKQHIST